MDNDLKWYVLRVRPRHEKTVAERLSERFEVFLPLISQRRKWSDRMKTIDVPLFSGYLFIKTAAKMKYVILEEQGAGGFVQFGAKPAEIRESEIEAIRKFLLYPETLTVEDGYRFTRGDLIRITRGVFAGVEGKVIQQKNKYRLFITIEQLGKIVSVEIDAEYLEKRSRQDTAERREKRS